VADKLRASTGQTVIVDNRPGAGGNLAADSVAKAPGDGYTMLVAPDSVMVVNPFIYAKLPSDPQKDFQSVSLIGKASLVLVVSPSLGVKTAQEFIDLAKSQPGKVNFASGGNGHASHLAMELFADRTGLKLNHVPYKGTSPALQGLMGGETAAMMIALAEAMPQIKASRIVAIATSGPTAKQALPELPQLQHFHKDLDMTVWFGLWVPASTRKEVVQELNVQVVKLLQQADVRDRLADFGMAPMSSTPAELDELMKRDQARFGPLVKQLGLKAD
jgi:tripartite-type tricarboxylate transporter receptor subunit TctC